ncbi:hypothetical protein PSOL_06790 [Candidatus Phytoplasma solani]
MITKKTILQSFKSYFITEHNYKENNQKKYFQNKFNNCTYTYIFEHKITKLFN